MHIPPGTPFRPNGLGAPHYDPALGDMVTEPKKSRWNDPLEMDGLLGIAGMMTVRMWWLGSFPKIPYI